MKVYLLFLCALGLATSGIAADEAATTAVLAADQQRLAAMRASDGAALGRVLSDEIVFVHSDGRTESKADYIRNMTAGDTAYADLKTTEIRARQIAADVVILTGSQEMKKKLGPTWSEIRLKFMSVWRREKGTWRMIAWQSMRPSGNSVVPPK